MNRIDTTFARKNKKLLSLYFTAGYPSLNDTMKVIEEAEKKGVDMLEVGIPFSDPLADGVLIQKAGEKALQNGMSLKILFEQLSTLREKVSIPIILMGYLNPIYRFGFEAFCQKCAETGIDGLIIPDLPFAEYMSSYKPIAEKHGIKIIMLITPDTSEERIREIDANSSGFIYLVSSASTTGIQQSFEKGKTDYFKRISEMGLKNPLMVGFGISNKKTADAANEYASGVIVGSKFIQLLSNEQTISDAVNKLLIDLEE